MSHRIFKILSRFNIGEWKQCRLFVEMELTGHRPLEIFDYLMKTRKKSTDWTMDEIHHQSIANLSKKSFLNEVSRLTAAVENYLSYKELQRNPQLGKLLLRKYYLHNKDESEWESSFKKSIEKFNDQKSTSYKDQFLLIQILHQAYHNTHPYKNDHIIGILEQWKLETKDTFSSYQNYIDLIDLHENYISKNVQKNITLKKVSSIPKPFIFDLLKRAYTDNNDQHHSEILEYLNKNEDVIDLEILTVVYGIFKKILTAHLLRTGNPSSAQFLYQISQKEIELIHTLELPLSPDKILSVFRILQFLDNLPEMDKLIIQYKDEFKDNPYYLFCLSIWQLSHNQLEQGINTLNTIISESINVKLNVRRYLIRAYCSYYDETEFCLDEIKKFKLWLTYNENYISHSTYQAERNFLSLLKMILRNESINSIRKSMEEFEYLSNRIWIYKEIKRRYKVPPYS